jgi:hypothetical protein
MLCVGPVFNVGHVPFAVGRSGGILPLPPAVVPPLEPELPLDPDEPVPLDAPLDPEPIPELPELPPDPEPAPLPPEAAPAPEPLPEPAPLAPEPLPPEPPPLLPDPAKVLVAADPHDATFASAARAAAVKTKRTLQLERMGLTVASLDRWDAAESARRAIL